MSSCEIMQNCEEDNYNNVLVCQVCETLNCHLDNYGRCDKCIADHLHICILCKRVLRGKYSYLIIVNPNYSELETELEAHTIAQNAKFAAICPDCIVLKKNLKE